MRRWTKLVIIAVVLGAAYWAWPLVGAAQLAEAAKRNDAAEIMSRVDLPSLRRSLARQIAAAYLDASGKGGKLGTLGRSLAGAAATTVADPYVAELLTPDNLTALLSRGQVNGVVLAGRALNVGGTLPGLPDLIGSDALSRLAASSFEDLTHFVIPLNPQAPPASQVRAHFKLAGPAWHLSGLDLSPDMVAEMARGVLAAGANAP